MSSERRVKLLKAGTGEMGKLDEDYSDLVRVMASLVAGWLVGWSAQQPKDDYS